MLRIKLRNNIIFGGLLLGGTGILIGVAINNLVAMAVGGALGILIGGLVGWLGGRTYLLIVCFGILVGAVLGYRTGDRDIFIMASGAGGAISGFFGAILKTNPFCIRGCSFIS